MLRQVIRIDEEKCDGCALCVPACHEGAIEIVDGKARLVSDRYCDGLGDCLGECPQGAITMETVDTVAYDEQAVLARLAQMEAPSVSAPEPSVRGCPGSAARALERGSAPERAHDRAATLDAPCELTHWPVQLRLLHPAAPYLAGSDMVLCADCVPFAYPDFHRDYLRERTVAVSCPKLDDLHEAVERLEAILTHSRPRRVTVARMMVPCCGGIAEAARVARERAGVDVPIEIHTIDPHGGLVDRRTI